ncbi:aminopeptidase P family protein [Polymorphobacter fuscus]|uniref:M24 family metallopeptidase n=1 Tax=Sandarakinorhabdus fusca TaxID=1439888 RepID=A0A7C9KJ04_9SPHN|nr:aminopeptidase P family protein [Polymorphobacter fuscus]KAB7646459.1 aminopeptidase P family protein [Polymorphobacter fuscus]MQT17701.1 M24 family metallopeptidase [Polymorphobacter fuscus]NJC09752.1 Xaa-Pro aminopeptidase [Polymorphobacter fuscus]
MSNIKDRLDALAAQLAADRLTGFVVPLTDEHMSEYVGAYAQRLEWLTGFGGSAGSAAVLGSKAAIFTDGRYTLQVREQVPGDLFEYQDVPRTSAAQWLAEHSAAGDRIGYDPWLHTRGWVDATRRLLADKGAELVAVAANPIDRIWDGRPAQSLARLEVQADEHAGQTAADKRAEIGRALAARGADAVVVAALDSIAWLLNIRGRDVSRTPVALAFAIVHADAGVDLFIAPEKLSEAVRAHLGPDVRVRPRADFAPALAGFGGRTVVADPASCVAAIFAALADGGATIIEARDPTLLAKAVKNPVEIAGTVAAHRRDGAALTRFLHWFDGEAPKGGLTEMSAAAKLKQFREQTNVLEDLSFDTISGAGPNAAIPHYRVSEESSRPIVMDSIYLVDSGGQYRDGTTDVTRTMIVGTPTAEMKDRFTRVLKGHIALARAIFPAGTRGVQLDALARQYLWEAGLDYAHGTGHGVGSYLSVHEGPQRIAAAWSSQPGNDEPLLAGMILSNEPGYYKSGEYGIRIENLVLVEERRVPGAEKDLLGFRELTLAPIDRNLIDTALLTAAERQWVDLYHARVRAEIGPQLDDAARAWLAGATAPL